MKMIKNKETFLALGMLSLIVSLILEQYVSQEPIVMFLKGIFIGLSLVMNLAFLVLYGLEKKISEYAATKFLTHLKKVVSSYQVMPGSM